MDMNDEIMLPCDVRQWVPHRPPMTMVTRLLRYAEWSLVEAEIAPDNRFLRDGVLDGSVIPEIVAQGCAAIRAYEERRTDLKGMLAGVRNVGVFSAIRSGDTLTIHVREIVRIDNCSNLEFKLFRSGDELCATGELSICKLP